MTARRSVATKRLMDPIEPHLPAVAVPYVVQASHDYLVVITTGLDGSMQSLLLEKRS